MLSYASQGITEEEVADVELGADGIPTVHLSLQYDQADAIRAPRYAAMPLWLVGSLALAWVVNRYYRET